jgi:ClpP class serine protease
LRKIFLDFVVGVAGRRYGFMFGKEAARKELVDKINELKDTIHKLQSGN